ncbi:sensor histidine kinase [Glutamicibacter creatinolyticus]|uniref:sensor histidine kinase n=1 Tax=Glutamicibacter creatinolyticus TaxID=162496 RepID=UPI00111024FB|nr:histidine kinase [Glutamicibacter creatinolyticus]
MKDRIGLRLGRFLGGSNAIIWLGAIAIAAITVSELVTVLQNGLENTEGRAARGAVLGLLILVILIVGYRFAGASLGAYIAVLLFGFGDADLLLLLIVSEAVFSALAASTRSSLLRTIYLAMQIAWFVQFGLRAPDDVITLVILAPVVFITFGATRSIFVLLEKNQQSAQQMELLRERTESAIRDERKNIARDLHDIVAHDITIVAMQSKAAKFANNESTFREAVEVISKLSSETLHDLRLMLNVLRSDGTMSDIGADLDGKPSATTIQALQGVSVFSQRLADAGFDVHTDVDEEITQLPRSAHTALYRVMQEATTNIIKHAEPGSQCSISLKRRGDTAVLRMVNQVMTSKKIATNDALWGGSGLIGMEDRMRAFGGQFEAGKHAHQWILVAEIPF